MLASMISSVTFVAFPGSSYAGNWSLLVPGFLIVPTLPLVAKVVIPFYREAVGVTAYEYFQKRFGLLARLYASAAFSLAHFSKMGFVLYLMALTISSMTGWNITVVIVTAAVVIVFYTVLGGIEAVVWTDVVQGFVLWIGLGIALGFLLFLPPGGPAAVFSVAAQNGKFSLGDPAWDLSRPTIPVAILYGLFWYGQRYVADQTIVQRYLLAKSDGAALRGVSLGALLCVPVWTLFMLIGTCVWSFFKLSGGAIPKTITKADQMFPYFLSTQLPHGVLGLLLAALTGAAMTMLASDLNSLASVATEDFYRAARPRSTDRQRLRTGKTMVIILGLLNVLTALALVHSKGSVLSMWFAVSAIASGGLGGLFLLAFLLPRATRAGAYAGIVSSMLFTIWAVLTKGVKPVLDLSPFNFPYDELTIGAFGNIILFAIGLAASLIAPATSAGETTEATDGTLWHWLRTRDRRHATSAL
jgi:solute:Na+ symporter, SSS family